MHIRNPTLCVARPLLSSMFLVVHSAPVYTRQVQHQPASSGGSVVMASTCMPNMHITSSVCLLGQHRRALCQQCSLVTKQGLHGSYTGHTACRKFRRVHSSPNTFCKDQSYHAGRHTA
jgi:hypothetical protein